MRSCVHAATFRSRKIRYATVSRMAPCATIAMKTQGGMCDSTQSIMLVSFRPFPRVRDALRGGAGRIKMVRRRLAADNIQMVAFDDGKDQQLSLTSGIAAGDAESPRRRTGDLDRGRLRLLHV